MKDQRKEKTLKKKDKLAKETAAAKKEAAAATKKEAAAVTKKEEGAEAKVEEK